jgi:peptidoglycan/xylan/chitin deacetylase (PgdA/CDA1 family)
MLITLVMHRVVEGAPGQWTDVSSSMLDKLLDAVCERQVPATTVAAWRGGRSLCLSFDDGSSSDYAIVFPRLFARGLRATFFIVPEWVGRPGHLQWDQIREMHHAGMEIGSHGLAHLPMSRLSTDEARREFDSSKRCIEDRLGAPVSTFAYPFGDHAPWCHRLGMEAGYQRLCLSRPGGGRMADAVLPRVSVHRRHTAADLPRLVEPGRSYLRWLEVFDRSRTAAKTILGHKAYVRLRNTLFR